MAEDEWSEYKAPDGRVFYFNRVTKQSVWEKPAEEKLQSEEMETEDSAEEGDYRLVGGSKRRKTGDGIVANGQVEQNLLNKNKFSPLVEENNNNNAHPAAKEATPAVPTSGKSAKGEKQPPLVVKNMSCSTLRQVMSSCAVKPIYKLTRFGIKIICITAGRFDVVREHLLKNDVEFYTHDKRSMRPHRVVIRGLPPWEPAFVKKVLKESYGLEAQEVFAIKRKHESTSVEETPFVVLFPKGYTNLKTLSEIKKVKSMSIRWEAYRRSKRQNVTQCRNCLEMGHGTRNCHLKARCNNCGGTHKTDECKDSQEAQPKRCANCSGPHEATDRCCPKRAEFIRSRQQAFKPKPPVRKTDRQSPPAPAFTEADFPPLPSAVPVVEPKDHHPRPAGNNRRNNEPQTGGSMNEEDRLYSSSELWGIFIEMTNRMKSCKTGSDQVLVLGYLVCKYGSKK